MVCWACAGGKGWSAGVVTGGGVSGAHVTGREGLVLGRFDRREDGLGRCDSGGVVGGGVNRRDGWSGAMWTGGRGGLGRCDGVGVVWGG